MLERMHAPRRQGRGSEPGKARRKIASASGADARLEEEVERRTAVLQAQLDTQHQRLREMGHRIKNNLQTLSALMLLKARRAEEESARLALLDMAERMGALSTAYRLTDSSDGDGVDASALVSEIAAELVASVDGERIALVLDLEPVTVGAEAAAPLALLVNELIGDAIRHAVPGGPVGRLAITARHGPDGTRLVIASDGIGRGEAEAPRDTFGRTLCEMFARQLKAELAFEDAAAGTHAAVLLPSG